MRNLAITRWRAAVGLIRRIVDVRMPAGVLYGVQTHRRKSC